MLNFLNNLLESANDNPEWVIHAGIATLATTAATTYYYSCHSNAASAVISAPQSSQRTIEQQAWDDHYLMQINRGPNRPPRRNQLR